MNRRRFLLASLAGALGGPLAAEAQPADQVRRIGVLGQSSATSGMPRALRRSRAALGYVTGKHVVLEWRWAEGQPDRLPGLASALLAHRVEIIIALANDAVRAAQRATKTV